VKLTDCKIHDNETTVSKDIAVIINELMVLDREDPQSISTSTG
jgi:hypothetical protein